LAIWKVIVHTVGYIILMLPPLFPKDTKESETKSDHEAKKPQERNSVKHSYRVMSSSLWVLSGIFLSVFSGLILLVWGIFALISSGDPVTASANNQDQYLGGQVYGSWAEQEMSDDANPPFNAQQLYGRLQTELEKYPELSAGITSAPVGGGKQVRIDDDKQSTAASTTKVLTAIAVLDGVDKGKYSLSQIAYQIFPKTEKDAEKDNSKNTDADSNSKPSATPTPSNTPTPSPTPTPTPTPVPKKVQLKEALRLMVNRSDNQAWEHLIMLVGSKNLQKYAENMGMQDYNVRN